MAEWKAGGLVLSVENEMKGRIAAVEEICALKMEDILDFYGVQQ